MKDRNKGRLLILGIVALCILIVYLGALAQHEWGDALNEKWKKDVEGVIWYKHGGGLGATGWYIADPENLHLGPSGWQYNVSVTVSLPGADPPELIPPGASWLPGKYYKDYEVGDYFSGRLETYMYDPPNNMVSFVIWGFCLAIIVGCMSFVMGRVKGWIPTKEAVKNEH